MKYKEMFYTVLLLLATPHIFACGVTLGLRHDSYVEVNLENGCHRGQTPAILEAGIGSEEWHGYADIWINDIDTEVFKVTRMDGTAFLPGDILRIPRTGPGPFDSYRPILRVSVDLDNLNDDFLCTLRQDSPSVVFYASVGHEIKGGCVSFLGQIASVGIRVNGSTVCDDNHGGLGGGGKGFSGGGFSGVGGIGGDNCLSCSSSVPQITIGGHSVSISGYQSQTMKMYGGIREVPGGVFWAPEVNLEGFWLRPGWQNGWSRISSSDPYTHLNPADTTSPVTKIQFTVQSPDGDRYYYEITGQWDNQSIAREETRRKIPLKEVRDQNDQLKYTYSYSDNRVTIARQNVPDPYYIIYEGGIDIENPEDTLKRIWAGKNLSDYRSSDDPDPANRTPLGGRWFDIQSEIQPNSDVAMITGISACGSCGGTAKQYDYVPALMQNEGYLISNIKGVDGTVLSSFEYDQKERLRTKWLGDREMLVRENVYEDVEWGVLNYGSPELLVGKLGGRNFRLRRDFVTNTQYRAKVFMMDDMGVLTEEIYYHNLQDYDPQTNTNWLTGPYSVYAYSRQGNIQTTTYPNGNKLYKHYDDSNNVTMIQWEGASVPHIQHEYQGYYYNYQSLSRINKSINAYGGVTEYVYEGLNLKTLTEPAPGTGISGSSRQVTTYTYDDQDRIETETKKDANENNITTKYVYDSMGNLEEVIDGYGGPNPLTTTYHYNEYNENTKTIESSGRVRRKFYSDAGTLIAEAVYDDDDNDSAVTATIYEYEDGQLKNQKTAKMDTPFVFTEAEAQTGGTLITWILESYEYDDYGRRTAVISDADGNALRTEYQYNNQGEIILVLKPDQRYQRTVRDGRGLVSREITGVKVGEEFQDKAITSYYYDLNGNLTMKVDPEGVTEIYQYDYRDRMVRSRRSR